MSTHKRIDAICAVITLLTVALAVLFMNGRALGLQSAGGGKGDGMFTANDLDAGWDASSATEIVLSGGGSTVNGNGAYAYGGDVYIVSPGRYALAGELTDGSVIIDARKNDKIWLLLDGAAVHCEDGAAIRIEQAGKVFLTLAEGTENRLSSGAAYNADAAADGTVYSRDDLTINGTGALTVDAAYRHGIVCNDDLVIAGGRITVNAARDGIHAHDSVRVREADLTITAGDDGITASNGEGTDFLYVESGRVAIPSCYEGLEAGNITIAGGTLDIAPADDGINARGGENPVIRVTGGDITIVNPTGRDADGLDSNGSIYLEGGRVFVSVADGGGNCALDYGSENGGECIVSGGTVIACGGSMLAEGFDASSPQGFLMYSAAAAAGTAVSLTDAAGNTLLCEDIPCGFSSLALSAPGLKVGDVCTLTVGGAETQITIDNSSAAGAGPFGRFGGGMPGDREFDGEPDGQPFAGREKGDGQWVAGQDAPNGREFADGQDMERPGRADMPGGGDRMGAQGPPEDGAPAFAPGAGRVQGDAARFPRQEQGMAGPGEDGQSNRISAGALALAGVSVAALLVGLGIAGRRKRG